MSVSYGGDSITFADGSVQSGGWTGFRNRIINGAMAIDQRNAGASVTPTATGYTIDRWSYELTEVSKMSVQQNAGSVTPPVGFRNYLGFTTVSAFSIVAASQFQLRQFIEGFNTADLMWGTVNAQTVTLSFWVRSSLTGTFGGSFRNEANNRSYPFTYTINSANTWEYKTVTVAGDTTGTWLTNNDRGIALFFGLGVGSDRSGTAGTWATNNFTSATGATSVVGTNGATFYITGVQLERGSTASSFEYRPYGTELALCQRYFISYGGTTGYERFAVGACSGTTTASASTFLPVPMRIAPSLSYSALANFGVYDGGNVFVLTGFALDQPSTTVVSYTATVSSGLTQYRPGIILSNNTSAARLQLSSEL